MLKIGVKKIPHSDLSFLEVRRIIISIAWIRGVFFVDWDYGWLRRLYGFHEIEEFHLGDEENEEIRKRV